MPVQRPARSQPEVWEAVWSNELLTEQAVRNKLKRELRTYRWRAIRNAFELHFGTLKGLRTIELGAGTGDISLLLATQGADATLLDANERALEIARFQFKMCGFEPKFVHGDFLNLDAGLFGHFDAAVSYGVVEHFVGNDRMLSCRSHVQVLRPGGMVAISVPNAWCPPYRIRKWWREKTGRWEWGLEVPFTRTELKETAESIGLTSYFIQGSPLLRDWDQFMFSPITSRIVKHTGFHFERRLPFDDYLGHALTLIGEI